MSLEEVAKRIELANYDTHEVGSLSKEKRLDRIAWAAYYNHRVYGGCSRSVLKALQDHLHLDGEGALKASTALAGGVARMGQTCGAVTGSVLAIGLVLGREELEDRQAYSDTLEASNELCDRAKKELGSTVCSDILKKLFGRSFDFKKDEEIKEWYTAGGLEKCSMVSAIVARIAADIILKLKTIK